MTDLTRTIHEPRDRRDETIAAGAGGMPMEELESRYRGWTISIERSVGRRETFLARKEIAVA